MDPINWGGGSPVMVLGADIVPQYRRRQVLIVTFERSQNCYFYNQCSLKLNNALFQIRFFLAFLPQEHIITRRYEFSLKRIPQ